jgi:hypothetical protein
VYECGGNAVLGYAFHLDTEGSSTIVARAYGTAVKILRVDDGSPRIEISRLHLASIAKFEPEMKRLLKDDRKVMLITRENMEDIIPRLSRASTPLAMPNAIPDSLILLKSVEDIVTATQLLSSSFVEKQNVSTRDGGRLHPKSEHLAIDWINVTGESNVFQGEVHLLTLRKFPAYVEVKLGGLVLARSVKYLGHSEGINNDVNTRLEWWKELRDEIKAHAKVLCCRYIIGYSETCTIYGDICILSALGTAAELKGLSQGVTTLTVHPPSPQVQSSDHLGLINPHHLSTSHSSPHRKVSLPPMSREVSSGMESVHNNFNNNNNNNLNEPKTPQMVTPYDENLANVRNAIPRSMSSSSARGEHLDAAEVSSDYNTDQDFHVNTKHSVEIDLVNTHLRKSKNKKKACVSTHVPYNHNAAPFAFMRLVPCLLCKRKWVPETILTTTELPLGLAIKGKGRLLEAKVCRPRKALNGEIDAVKVSEVLPFVEYDLQRQIILKLKVLGMNSAFGYTCQIELGADVVVATAFCTAVYVNSLPMPTPIQITRNRELRSSEQEVRLNHLQREIEELTLFNQKLLTTQNEVPEMMRRKRTGSKTIDSKLFESKLPQQALQQQSVPSLGTSSSPHLQPTLILANEFTTERMASKDDYDSGSVRSRTSSSSSSPTESSSTDSFGDGDDSTSLASPSSSSSSSESQTEEETSDDQLLELPGSCYPVTKENSTADPSSNKHTNPEMTRQRSQSQGSRKSELLDTFEGTGGPSTSNLHQQHSRRRVPKTKSSRAQDENSSIAPVTASISTTSKFMLAKKRKEKKAVYKDDRIPYILEVDDETDADILSVLQDWIAPTGIDMVNIGKMPTKYEIIIGTGRQVTVIRRGRLIDQRILSSSASHRASITSVSLNSVLNRLFQEAYLKLCFTVKNMIPCQVRYSLLTIFCFWFLIYFFIIDFKYDSLLKCHRRRSSGNHSFRHGAQSRSEIISSCSSKSCFFPRIRRIRYSRHDQYQDFNSIQKYGL